MSKSKKELVKYRLQRAFETHDDALLLAQSKKWNSVMNRFYYAAFYAVSALVLFENQTAYSHNGVNTFFSEKFIKTGRLELSDGKLFSQLFTWSQKGDYDDLFDFDEKTVSPYLDPVKNFIEKISSLIQSSFDKTP